MSSKRYVKYDGNYENERTFGMTVADENSNKIQTTIIPDSTGQIIKRSRFIVSKRSVADIAAEGTLFTIPVPYTLTAGNLYNVNVTISIFIDTGSDRLSGTYEWQQIIEDSDPANSGLNLIGDLVVTTKSATFNMDSSHIGQSSFATSISGNKYTVDVSPIAELNLNQNNGSCSAILDIEYIELTPV